MHVAVRLATTSAERNVSRQDGVLSMLSPALQGEVAYKLNRKWLERVHFLRGADKRFLVHISMALELMVFAPGELPESGKMYIVYRGYALYGGRLLTSGRVWGDDVMLADATLQRCFRCIALSYLECNMLTFAKLWAIAELHPDVKPLMRIRMRYMALRRMIVALAKRELGIPPWMLLSARHAPPGRAATLTRDRTSCFMSSLAGEGRAAADAGAAAVSPTGAHGSPGKTTATSTSRKGHAAAPSKYKVVPEVPRAPPAAAAPGAAAGSSLRD